MTVIDVGHWHGDPARYCGELHVHAETQWEALLLARLRNLLADPHDRAVRLEALAAAADDLAADAPHYARALPC